MKILILRHTAWFGLLLFLSFATRSQAENWHQWRGVDGNNHASDNTSVPIRWDLKRGENILWKVPIPGRGHSSPVIVDGDIFLTTSSVKNNVRRERSRKGTQSLLKIDATTGRLVENWILHRDTIPTRIHPNNSHASATVAVADGFAFALFHTNDSLVLSKMSIDGRLEWQRRVCEYNPKMYEYGYGSSPIIEDDLVIIGAEYDGKDSGIYALEVSTGKQIWKTPRPVNITFGSPLVATVAGTRQVLLSGAGKVTSYDPVNGKENWEVEAGTAAHCGSVAFDDRKVLVTGGYPQRGTWCIGGTGKENLIWESRIYGYEQSPLVDQGCAFIVSGSGVATCLDMKEGVQKWQERIFSGGVSASPLLVDRKIVAANERGQVTIFAANPDRFELISENQMGDSIFASPVAVNDTLYFRTGIGSGEERQEYLVAVRL